MGWGSGKEWDRKLQNTFEKDDIQHPPQELKVCGQMGSEQDAYLSAGGGLAGGRQQRLPCPPRGLRGPLSAPLWARPPACGAPACGAGVWVSRGPPPLAPGLCGERGDGACPRLGACQSVSTFPMDCTEGPARELPLQLVGGGRTPPIPGSPPVHSRGFPAWSRAAGVGGARAKARGKGRRDGV